MFKVDARPDPIESILLKDEDAGSRVVLAPGRGGLVTRFFAKGREHLYLDEKSLRDPNKNVRGGVPVLFPSPGKLTEDKWATGDANGSMKQHGFARNLPWREVKRSTEGAASVTLELVADDATRAMFPWLFDLRIEHRLVGAALTLAIEVQNRDVRPMPFGLGFHPYFAILDREKPHTRIPSKATRAFDNVAKKEIALAGIDLARGEVDLHLVDHLDTTAELRAPAGWIRLTGSKEFKRWVVWTLEKKDFVCLEPWTCPSDALNTGTDLMHLEPGQRAKLELTIEALDAMI